MADPFSNTPVLPGTALQAVDVRPYQAGITPAIAALEDAFHKGMVDYNDLVDAGVVKPRERRAKAAALDLSARQSQAQMDAGLPELQAKQGAADINAGLQVLPSRTQAAISQNTAAGSQAGLQNVQISGAVPGAELEAGEMQRDPTGMLTTTRKMWSQYSFGQQVPRDAEGHIDYDKMRQQIQESFMPGSTADGSPHSTEGVNAFRTMMLSQMWSSDYGKQVAAMAKEKNLEDLMYDENHQLRSPYAAAPLIAKGEIKPKMTADQVTAAAANIPQQEASLGMLAEARKLVAKEGTVGLGLSEAAPPKQKADEVLAALGNEKAKERVADRNRLRMTLGQGILDTIRTLGQSHAGRVLGKEFETMKTETMPEINDTPANWNKWLSTKEDLIKRALDINKMQATGKLPGDTSTAPSTAPAAATSPEANAGLKKVLTQADYDALPRGTRYVDSAGNVATKR